MDINLGLSKIIDNIKGQDIKLISVDFDASEKQSGDINDKEIDTSLNIKMQNIGIGLAEHPNGNKTPIIYSNYKFYLNYTYEEKTIIKMEVSYNLIITLENDIKELVPKNTEKIMQVFFDNTGRIILYPYFRHLSDLLIRESSYYLPPLPPLSLTNQPES